MKQAGLVLDYAPELALVFVRYFGLITPEGHVGYLVRMLPGGDVAEVRTDNGWVEDDDAWLAIATGSLMGVPSSLAESVG